MARVTAAGAVPCSDARDAPDGISAGLCVSLKAERYDVATPSCRGSRQGLYRLRQSTIGTSYGGVALQWRRLCGCVHEGAMARPWTGNGQFCSAINCNNRRKNVLSFSRQIALHVVIVYLVVVPLAL